MTSKGRTSAPRQQLLEAASRLFYTEGINAVGVDRILQDAGVPRATMYRHFGGKEALVVAYLEREDAQLHTLWDESLSRAVSPRHKLELAIEIIATDAYGNHTMGCPFIKAAAEFPDPESPVRQVVAKHRAWFHQDLHDILVAADTDDAAAKADALAMLRDSLLVGSYLDDREKSRRTFVRMARWVAGLA